MKQEPGEQPATSIMVPELPWSTPAKLRAFLLDNGVLKGNHRSPSEAALRILGRQLSTFAKLASPSLREGPNPVASLQTTEAIDAIDRLLVALQAYEEGLSCLMGVPVPAERNDPTNEQQADAALSSEYEADVGFVRSLKSILEAARHRFAPKLPQFSMDDDWAAYADVIADAFQQAMQASSAKPVGLSDDGPVPRFVQLVLPIVLGRADLDLKRPNIRQQIKRRRDNPAGPPHVVDLVRGLLPGNRDKTN